MRRAAKAKGQESTGSSLLSPQENQRLEDLLGRRCAALSSGVAQLLMALPSEPNRWTTQQSGVVCFVKDSHQRSFFIRLYDLKAGKLVWEQEIYNQLMYQRARPFFHTFPGDDCQVGLNFADVTEAENFFTVVEDKISQRNNRIDKKHRKGSDCTDRGALPPLPPPNDSGPFTAPAMPPIVQVSTSKSKKEKKEKEKKNKKKGGKLLKGDIGAPSGFTHVSHCGMGSTSNDLDPDLKKLLSCAGISEADMDDSETSQLIYDVIERSGGMEAVKKAMHQEDSPRPPLPGGHRGSLPQVPPGSSPGPPPSQGRMGPLPPIPGQSAPPSHRGSLPPTPPRPVGSPQTPDGRGAPLPARSASLGPLPAVPAGGRTGPLPQPPGARSGALPPPPGGRSGGLPQPPLPGERRESLAPIPGKRPGAQMSERRGSSLPPQPMEPARPPLPPGGRSAHLPPPPRDNSGFFPPPPKSEMPLPPPSSDFLPPPPCDSFLPPPPEDFLDSEPPPPPTQSRFPPRSNSSGFGPPPPPVSTKPSGGGPPPPPPPPPPAAPRAAPPPMNFGNSSSSPAAPAASSGGEVGRGALLAQIQTGMKLKKVTANPEPPSPALDTGEGIVGALMMVMQKRSKAIHSSDEDDEFDDEEEDDEEWD